MPAKPPDVSLRVQVPLALFERISDYRHMAKHDSKNQALVALLAAGLAAMSAPAQLPPDAEPKPAPPARKRHGLVAYAGANGREL